MKAAIAGLGWVTPLGTDLGNVWRSIRAGETPAPKPVENPETGRTHHCFAVPPGAVEHLGRNPRLRRSSALSYFAAAASQNALEDAGVSMTPDLAARTAVVLAVSNGGVIYTRRFYDQIIKDGAHAASPLLFPETVYNAPASHLASLFGLDGASYTLVGDNSVGFSALHFGAQLLAVGDVDRCLVVGCEELDWILSEAYRDWRLTRTPLAEGAGAILLSREGDTVIETHPGCAFFRQGEARTALKSVLDDLSEMAGAETIISCANGSFVDRPERELCMTRFGSAEMITPKQSLGEAPGASGLWQVITAALALRNGAGPNVLVPAIGFNQHATAAIVTRVTPS